MPITPSFVASPYLGIPTCSVHAAASVVHVVVTLTKCLGTLLPVKVEGNSKTFCHDFTGSEVGFDILLRTASNAPAVRLVTSCVPQTAVAARSSFTPGSK